MSDIRISYGDLSDYIKHIGRGLKLLDDLEDRAVRLEDDNRIAHNRILNTRDRLRAALLLLGTGDTVQAHREVTNALECLTEEGAE